MTQNAMVRALPTHDVYYRRFIKTGRVLPFDRLQTSVIWSGTPVYILGTTQDKATIRVHFWLGYIEEPLSIF